MPEMSIDNSSPLSRFDMHSHVALITGSSRGLGRAMAFAFARAGADVVITSRKLDACKETAAEIERETGRSAMPYASHVGDWQGLEGLVEAVYERYGRLDVLVNNAGISPVYDRAVDISEDLWDKVFAVNVKGAFRLSALVGGRMTGAGGGSIINISSGGAVQPTPETLPYSAAKAALNNITLGLARTYAPLVRVNCIMAGPFRTDATSGWADGESVTFSARDYALARIGEPDEIVGAALYLASRASSFTTGSVLRVDGGMR